MTKVLALFALSFCLLVSVSYATCALTEEHWIAIHTALQQRDYYTPLKAANLCEKNETLFPDSLVNKYKGCTGQTLEQTLVAQGLGSNCRTFLEGKLYNGPEQIPEDGTLIQRALDICSDASLAATMNTYFCMPLHTVGCPRQIDIFEFTTFANCHKVALLSLTLEQKAEYFALGKDRDCMVNNKVCKDLDSWKTCPVLVGDVFEFIDKNKGFNCDNMMPTVQERCNDTYKTNFERYCPPLTVFEANIYTILVTCIAGPILIVMMFVCYRKMYRAHYISADDVLKQAAEVGQSGRGGGDSVKMYHPELAAIVASKYKGVTFNPMTGQWAVAGKQEKFEDEQAAARFAYINLAGLPGSGSSKSKSHTSYSTARSGLVSNDFSKPAYAQEPEEEPEYVVTAVPLTPEQIKARRLQQLISFYEYWEPSKADIPAHAENLLNRHDFEHVARAIKTKYGVLPVGWSEELEV